MVELDVIDDVPQDDIQEYNFKHSSINVQCKDCHQTFGYFSYFLDVGYYRGTNYFLINREDLDWDINIIEQLVNVWCRCGAHLGIQWDENHMLFKKTAIYLQY